MIFYQLWGIGILVAGLFYEHEIMTLAYFRLYIAQVNSTVQWFIFTLVQWSMFTLAQVNSKVQCFMFTIANYVRFYFGFHFLLATLSSCHVNTVHCRHSLSLQLQLRRKC